MSAFDFKINNKSNKSKARTGTITTPHGDIQTPAFVACATKGTLKSLTPEMIDVIGTQLLFVNTYHMVLSPGVDIVEKVGGIHKMSNIQRPIITDSGGFQVFSLGSNKKIRQETDVDSSPTLVKVTDDGVKFRSHIDGTEYFFTPEFSITAQQKIGADLIVAFDECLATGATYSQTKKSLFRTHDWAKRSLEAAKKNKLSFRTTSEKSSQIKDGRDLSHSFEMTQPQQLYGVIQGGMFEDLRKESARFITSLPFWGLAIGGVSVGETKAEMRQAVSAVIDVINSDPRPRHLLGVGHIDDILDLVKMGIDTFDCVMPTRLARLGRLYSSIDNDQLKIKNYGEIEIIKNSYKNDLSKIDKDCSCYACTHFTRAYLHHLFKQRELFGYTLATIHNLTFMERLFSQIRQAIEENTL